MRLIKILVDKCKILWYNDSKKTIFRPYSFRNSRKKAYKVPSVGNFAYTAVRKNSAHAARAAGDLYDVENCHFRRSTQVFDGGKLKKNAPPKRSIVENSVEN